MKTKPDPNTPLTRATVALALGAAVLISTGCVSTFKEVKPLVAGHRPKNDRRAWRLATSKSLMHGCQSRNKR